MMKDYIAMTSQSLMTLPEDSYMSGALRSLLACLRWLPLCFQQQCRNLKVIRKFIVTSPILNRFSTFLHHVVQNRKICKFVKVDKALQQKISRYDALFTAFMQKSIVRMTWHFRNFTGYWEIFHKSVYFEAIFEIFSLRSSEIKDLQLLCRSTTRYSRKFRDRMLCLRHSTYSMRPIQNISIFRFSFLI
jgi:hypothetical protein